MDKPKKKQYVIAYSIYMTMGFPAIGSIAKVVGKQYNYFPDESYKSILIEYFVIAASIALMILVIVSSQWLLTKKDSINNKSKP